MPLERLTDLTSENRPRPGGGIGHGDVVQFPKAFPSDTPRRERMTEGIVKGTTTEKRDLYDRPFTDGLTDQFGRPVFQVEDAEGKTHYPLGSECTRVDPPVQPHDGAPDSFGW